jgi:hypothetical protein
VEVEVLGEGSGYDEVRSGGVEVQALDDANFRGLLRQVNIFI